MTLDTDTRVIVKYECGNCGGDGGRRLHTTGDFLPCPSCGGAQFVREELSLAEMLGSLHQQIATLEQQAQASAQRLAETEARLRRSEERLHTAELRLMDAEDRSPDPCY